MNDLKLAIYEAENNGEIDIYTRDMMLDIINEATNLDEDFSRQVRSVTHDDIRNGKVDSGLIKQIEKFLSQFPEARSDMSKKETLYKKMKIAKSRGDYDTASKMLKEYNAIPYVHSGYANEFKLYWHWKHKDKVMSHLSYGDI